MRKGCQILVAPVKEAQATPISCLLGGWLASVALACAASLAPLLSWYRHAVTLFDNVAGMCADAEGTNKSNNNKHEDEITSGCVPKKDQNRNIKPHQAVCQRTEPNYI